MTRKQSFLLEVVCVWLALLSSAAVQSVAAPISWQAPTAITSADQALSQESMIDYAVAWDGLGGNASVTFDGGDSVSFESGTIDGSGILTVTGAAGIQGTNNRDYYGTSNDAFNAVLGGSAYDGVDTITLTQLTPGQTYLVQLFALDDRGCCTETQTFSDTDGDTTAPFMHSDNDFVDGTFTADATTETIIGVATRSNGGCALDGCSYLNAVVVYDVPEPGCMEMIALGVCCIGAIRRRPACPDHRTGRPNTG